MFLLANEILPLKFYLNGLDQNETQVLTDQSGLEDTNRIEYMYILPIKLMITGPV